MDRCEFYSEQCQVIKNTEICAHQQSAGVNITYIPLCGHKHSPLSQATVGSNSVIQCAGNIGKCQIPNRLRQ